MCQAIENTYSAFKAYIRLGPTTGSDWGIRLWLRYSPGGPKGISDREPFYQKTFSQQDSVSGQCFNDDLKGPRLLFSAVGRLSFHPFDLHQKLGASHKILFTLAVSPASILTTTDPLILKLFQSLKTEADIHTQKCTFHKATK